MALAWVVSVIASLGVGFYARTIQDRLVLAEKVLLKKITKEKEKAEAEKSTFIDLDDPLTAAKVEHEEMMARLNPHTNQDEET